MYKDNEDIYLNIEENTKYGIDRINAIELADIVFAVKSTIENLED